MRTLAVGLDLAASPRRPSGLAILSGSREVTTLLVYTDDEILDEVEGGKPLVVAIDAPLSIPSKGVGSGSVRGSS